MSRFSGKCDFSDHIEIFGIENVLKSEIYLGDDDHRLSPQNYGDIYVA